MAQRATSSLSQISWSTPEAPETEIGARPPNEITNPDLQNFYSYL